MDTVRVRKPLTNEQRARKNANDRARRAAAKAAVAFASGFENVEAAVAVAETLTEETVETFVKAFEPKRGRGRPAGSRNKPKVALVLVDVTEALVEVLADLSPVTAAWLRG